MPAAFAAAVPIFNASLVYVYPPISRIAKNLEPVPEILYLTNIKKIETLHTLFAEAMYLVKCQYT